MNAKTPLFIASILGLTMLGAAAAADLTLDQCPAPVKEAILSHTQGGKLDDIKSVTANGRTLYVAEIDLSPTKDKKLHITADGTVVKVREEIDLASAPAAVQSAAKALVPTGGRIDDVDREVADGKTTYLVEISRTNANDIKAVLAEDGTVLSQYGE